MKCQPAKIYAPSPFDPSSRKGRRGFAALFLPARLGRADGLGSLLFGVDLTTDPTVLRFAQRLQAAMSQKEYQTWFAPSTLNLEEGRAVFTVPNRFYAQWINERYSHTLRQALAEVTGRELAVDFVHSDGQVGPQPPGRELRDQEVLFRQVGGSESIHSRYTFDSFVVGPCNELAHAACKAVADLPGRQYNPLFLFGGAGLGKTHLLAATGHALMRRFPGKILHYCSAEAFTNEMIQAVRYDGVAAFREKYRRVEFLLLDDVQFLAGRERTQEEFFHTFNALYEANKQVILTSDKMPREIPGMEKRLCTRFEWGLIADLQPPDEETKVAILQKKASERGLVLSRNVAAFLARQPEGNVRVLEGYLTRLIAVSSFQGAEVTIDLARKVVGPLVSDRQVSLESILSTVAAEFGVGVDDLKGSRKNREVSHPRQVAMFLARRMTKASFPEIGRALGGKDHSTVVKGVKKIRGLLGEDPELADRVRQLERTLSLGDGNG